MKQVKGGVTAPKGFKATGVDAGIKNNTKKDMAMIYSDAPCSVGGTFTTNLVKAAPVKWDSKVVYETKSAQAVIVNSGVANACTGEEGYGYCVEMAKETAALLKIPYETVLVASTGVIGKQLPMDSIKKGISMMPDKLGSTLEDGTLAAEAIMTTDTVSKETAVEITIGGKTVTIGGMCKGSGMIHPNMATMLCFVTTDAAIESGLLLQTVQEIVADTFNMISVDGDTSTNDTLVVLANGLSGAPKITKDSGDYQVFYEALYHILEELSKKIAGDGEGATCLFEAQTIHAKTKEQAKILSKSVITSSLTKAAIFGHDANWGRILCAMGYSGADFEPELVDIYFESEAGKLKIVENGCATDYSEEKATEILSEKHVKAILDIKQGDAYATAYGCDLTFDYVKINADYRS